MQPEDVEEAYSLLSSVTCADPGKRSAFAAVRGQAILANEMWLQNDADFVKCSEACLHLGAWKRTDSLPKRLQAVCFRKTSQASCKSCWRLPQT